MSWVLFQFSCSPVLQAHRFSVIPSRLEEDDGCVSTQLAVPCVPQNNASIQDPDSDGPQRDNVRRDQDGPSGSRTTKPSPPGMREEPYQRERWVDEGAGPVRSPGWQETVGSSSSAETGGSSGEPLVLTSDSVSVDPTNSTTTAAALHHQDEAPPSQCPGPRGSVLLHGVQRASAVPWTTSSTSEHRYVPLKVPSSPVCLLQEPNLLLRLTLLYNSLYSATTFFRQTEQGVSCSGLSVHRK